MSGRHLVTLLATASFLPASAVAQTTGDAPPPAATTPATAQGAQSYTPADFARFSPKTALDMLRQVPGFSIQQQDGELRGLGQATGNVLINGERFSGKSNDVVSELSRISAANVQRIDIVDGATLNISGLSGQVANIITSTSGVSGRFSWNPRLRAKRVPPRLLDADVSVSGKLGGVDYTVSLENRSNRAGNAGPELVRAADGTLLDRRHERLDVKQEQPKIAVSLKRNFANGSVANLNASGQLFHLDADEISLRSGPGLVDRDRRFHEQEREWNYELGGDYEFGLGGGRLKLIGLRRFEHSPYEQTLFTSFADGSPTIGEKFTQVANEAETIGRAEYRWKAGRADWQISAEGALNILDIDNRLFVLGAGDIFEPVPLPNAAAEVKEKRAEAMITYGRPLSPSLTLQLSAGGEYSELSQTGANGLTRTFYRPKGYASLAWKASPRLDISAKIERKVGQLNFFDFVASTNISGGTSNAGNANLVPPQSWEAEVEAKRNLGPWGTTKLKLYGRRYTDIVDIIPIDGGGQAPGNIKDPATLFGGQWTSTFNFDPIGWAGAKLDLDIILQKTSLKDPLTGERRPFNEVVERQINASFRHDVPGSNWAYGWNYEAFKDSGGRRLDQTFQYYDHPGGLGIFAEHKNVMGLTVRGEIFGLLGSNESFTRSFYAPDRRAALLFTEARDRFYGHIFTLNISGKI